ncbi:Wzz/FepE/Etk N-terminal domain-containing protein [Mesorhizobium sp. SP-1A]|uniref:Wzz/FepE/Etk N-terminal domain-containing protein n=1 Tax=Mesorhizobium sp. SP-1A TaxID=3077840 RepID=UPI0028F71F94|nr:Wzz/FepE/Etk N-terminal domain-containing protein [Mesorhizobium sp. SP-1A]
MDQSANTDREVELLDIFDMLWSGKFIILLTTVLFVIAGGLIYYVVPRVYQSEAVITPMRQTSFANFAGLVNAGAFAYTPETLFAQFTSYLRDVDQLAEAAKKSDLIKRGERSEDEYQNALVSFARDIQFVSSDKEPNLLRMRIQTGNAAALNDFVRLVLDGTNARFAHDLEFEVNQHAAADAEAVADKRTQLELQVEALRQRTEAEKGDRIDQLTEQTAIARAFSLEKPLALQTATLQQSGGNVVVTLGERDSALPQNAQQQNAQNSTSVKVESNQPPLFFLGYAALDEQKRQLEARKLVDPFAPGLRDLQQQVAILKKDNRAERVARLLGASKLGDPQLKLAQYDVAAASSKRIAPKLVLYGASSLLLGLVTGSIIALLRGAYARRLA